MSCRSSAGNSAVTSHARITTGLSDMQTLSTFHALIREGASQQTRNPTSEEVDQWATSSIERIRADENLTPARRQSLINRLEQLRQPNALLPNGATFYAWQHLDERATAARNTLNQAFDNFAAQLGIPREEVQRRFEADRAAADTNRRLNAPSHFTDSFRSVFASASGTDSRASGAAGSEGSSSSSSNNEPEQQQHLPLDRGTLYALSQLAQTSRTLNTSSGATATATAVSARNSVPSQPQSQSNQPTGTGARGENRVAGIVRQPLSYNTPIAIRSAGYDPTTRQLEVELTGGSVWQYENIEPAYYQELTNPNLSDRRAVQMIGSVSRSARLISINNNNNRNGAAATTTAASVPLPVPVPPTPIPVQPIARSRARATSARTRTGSTSNSTPVQPQPTPQMNPIVRQPVTSSNVYSLGYDPAGRRLQIEFNNGSVYEYTGMSAETYQELTAPGVSVGSAYNRLIRGNDDYVSRRLPDGHTDPQPQSQSSPSLSQGGQGQGQGQMRCPDCGEFISATVAHVCHNVAGAEVLLAHMEAAEAEAAAAQVLSQTQSQVQPLPVQTFSTEATATATATATSFSSPEELELQLQMQLAAREGATPEHPTATPDALFRALRVASFGATTSEQLRNIQYSALPFLSPPASRYLPSIDTATINLPLEETATAGSTPLATVTTTATTTLTAPDSGAVVDFFDANSENDFNMLIASAVYIEGQGQLQLDGSVTLTRTSDGGIGVSDFSNLRCRCLVYRQSQNGNCPHVDLTVQAVRNRYAGSRYLAVPSTLASGAARHILANYLRQEREAAEAARRAAQVAAEEASRQAAAAAVPSYGQDMGAFQRSYSAAKERKARGEAPVPYLRENATNGLGAQGGGRGFGVEIEFVLDGLSGYDRRNALINIGRDLQAAGITQSADQQSYHSGRGDYSQWRFERDATVSGEIVSPILYDEPQTWQQLDKVCEIVRRHGGKASARTGSHVHVACGNYDHTPSNHNNLLQLFKQNEDVLYRLAQNPAKNQHRGTSYCAPNTLPAQDYTSVADVNRAARSQRYQGINFQAVNGSEQDHVEFRLWDGTLDPAAIQSQVKLSLAMTEAAFRAEPGAFRGNAEPKGTHRNAPVRTDTGTPTTTTRGRGRGRATATATGTTLNNGGRGAARLSGEAWEQDSASFRNFVDTLFTRTEDKEQLTSLFAVTKWQTS
jgi:hypothetical protein